MSTSRGNITRKRPQKHQNRTAFKNDLHDTSHKTKFINSLEVTGVCNRCKDIIEWKIKYKKYKSLTAPRKCVTCDQKTVKYAYHMLCTKCAKDKHICAKCVKPIEGQDVENQNVTENIELQNMLKDLPERKRRTIMRKINKLEGQTMSSDLRSQINDMVSKMESFELDDDEFSDFSDTEQQT